MELLVTYNKYKTVLNLPENLTEPDNFQVKQWQAMDYIYRNISQIHLFPVSKSMYARMKPAYKRQFETALCEQIKYMINNASIFDDPASVIVSSSIGNYSHGPMGDKTLAGFIKLLAPITDNLLTALGWRYMSIDDKLPFEDYYEVGYDEFFLRSISKDEANHIITIFDNNGNPTSFGYADLPPYEAGKFLHVNSETGLLEWADIATPILDNFYTKAESDARFASKSELLSEAETRQSADNDLKNQIEEKIDLLGPEVGSGEQYHFPYNFDAKFEDNKIKVHLDTITLDNKKTIKGYDKELELPNISNMVTTDTEQTITGYKSFKNSSMLHPAFEVKNGDETKWLGLDWDQVRLVRDQGKTEEKSYFLKFPEKNGTFATTDDLNNYIKLLGNEEGSGQPYHLPYNIRDLRFDTTDSKLKGTIDTITVDNNKTLTSYPLEVEIPTGTGGVTQEYVDTQDQAVKAYADEKLDGKLDLLGDVPGWAPGTNPYKLSYYYEMIPGADKVTVKAKTVSLDNKKDQGEYSLDVLSATTTTAGLMSASDKAKIGNAQTKVKYGEDEPTESQDGDIWMF